MRFSESILADVILPLEAAAGIQLLLGNILVGLLEAYVVRRAFGIRSKRLPYLIILANYISTIVGVFLIPATGDFANEIFGLRAFYHVGLIGLFLAAVYWLISVIIEWPLVYLSFPEPDRKALRTLRASALGNLASYVLLVPWFWLLGTDTLAKWHLQSTPSFAVDPNMKVIYVSRDGGIDEMAINGQSKRELRSNGSVQTDEWISAKPDTVAMQITIASGETEKPQVIADISPYSRIRQCLRNGINGPTTLPYDADPERFLDLRSSPVPWEFEDLFGYANRGITFSNRRTGERENVAVDILGMSWWVDPKSVTMLPGDQVIFCIGPQIVLADLNTGQITPLTLGRSPIVLLGSEQFVPATEGATQPAITR